jgi:glyoxylase-like metal-dependent hydrolase (beta-lactamase superfamily II)
MIFQSFLLDVNESNCYLVASEQTRDAILIDAGDFDGRIRDYVDENNLNLEGVFITHDHYDHTSGLADLMRQYRVKVWAGSGGAGRIAGRRVAHGHQIEVGELMGIVLATPGHTSDSLSLAFPGVVFTGDALFSGSVGGTGSSDAARQQTESIRRHIFTLPADCEIHPGHGPASTVAIERQFNPFFA